MGSGPLDADDPVERHGPILRAFIPAMHSPVRWLAVVIASTACSGTPRDAHDYVARTVATPQSDDAVVLERRGDPRPTGVAIDRVVVLPAQGFSILQITAHVPGRGEVDLLKAPDVAEAARIYRET